MKIQKLLTIALFINPTAIYAGLNDTGITTCSNATQNGLPCPVAGFPGQDAEYGTNSFDFTKLDANGNAMSVAATNHSCVQDNVTGLMWEVKTDDGGLRDKDNAYTFDQAATFAANVNATNLCGHNDWRVPNIYELVSIVDYSIADPGLTIDEDFFPYTSNTYHWTNAPYAAVSSGSWIVAFDYGYVSFDDRFSGNAVRLVRSGQVTFSSFTSLGDGTVTQVSTGLMWAKCSLGQGTTDCSGSATDMTWANALTAADNSTLAGYTDWRLPNAKELQTLVDYTKYSPSINATYFPNTLYSWYWSSSPYAAVSSGSWFVGFYDGDVNGDGRDSGYAVRLVRSGQLLFLFSLTINKLGVGAGTVASNPAGIACGTVCAANFAENTAVTLTATPVAGSVFAGWGGACSGSSGNVCSVTMDAAKSATATFNLAVTAPAVSTSAASNITQTSATLNGTVLSSGATAYVTFDFGTTTSYGTNSAATPYQVYSSSAVAVSATKTGLTCNTTYHYRVQASNSAGTSYGYNQSFTTAACPTYTVTPNVGNGGSVSPNTQQTVNPNTSASFTVTPNNGYAINTSIGGTCPQGWWNGNVWTTGAITTDCSVNFSFNLITAAPIVTTTGPSNITDTSATINGNVVSTGATATASFAFGPTNAYGTTIAANPAQVNSSTPVAVNANKTGLTCNTIYNYRLQATNSVGTNYGANQSLQTAACPAFTVTPSVAIGGNVYPNTAQSVNPGSTASFTVTPNAAYTRNLTVGGNCPQGSWNSNVWTTGAISQHCTVSFGFIIKTYTVTSSAGNGGSVTPNTPQPVNHGATKSFTVTANAGYAKNTTVTGTCPQGTWSGNLWTTGAITATCSVNFSFTLKRYTVTATATTGGTVNPTSATVNHGTTASFTVTPNTGYTRNLTVTGTCPAGSWNSNVWTTGTITAPCSVSFGFTIKTYTVTSSAGNGGSITPNTPQPVNHGATKSFTVTANAGYAKNTTVTGTCPQGTWNGGSTGSPSVWTTGAITANCTVAFSFTLLPVNAWLNPPTPTILRDRPFTLEVIANSNSVKIGSYVFEVKLDPSKLLFDTTYQNASNTCSKGVCPGTNALSGRVNFINTTANTLTLNGNDDVGVGPGNDLQLLVMHLKTKLATGTTPVTLTTTRLTTPDNGDIGTEARGATVKVSYGYCGDADGNTLVNIVDALAIARKLVGLNPPPTVDVTLADVNENGRLDINDALMIARYSIGLVLPLEVCAIGQPLM